MSKFQVFQRFRHRSSLKYPNIPQFPSIPAIQNWKWKMPKFHKFQVFQRFRHRSIFKYSNIPQISGIPAIPARFKIENATYSTSSRFSNYSATLVNWKRHIFHKFHVFQLFRNTFENRKLPNSTISISSRNSDNFCTF